MKSVISQLEEKKKQWCESPECCQTHGGQCWCSMCKKMDEVIGIVKGDGR